MPPFAAPSPCGIENLAAKAGRHHLGMVAGFSSEWSGFKSESRPAAIKIEKTDEKISSRMTNMLSWIAAALLGAASAVVLALLVWNGFLYLEYLRQPPLARPFSHGSFAPVGDDDDWTFKTSVR